MSQAIFDRAKRIESLVKELGFPGSTHYERITAAGDALPEVLRDDMRSFMLIRNLYAHQDIFALTDKSLDAYIWVGDSVIARLCEQLGKPVEKFEPRLEKRDSASERADTLDADAIQQRCVENEISPLPRDSEYDELYAKHEAFEVAQLAEDRRLREESNGDYELYLAKQAAARRARVELEGAKLERERKEQREQLEREVADQAKKRKRDAEIANLEQQIKQLREQRIPSRTPNLPGLWGTVASGLADLGVNMSKIRELEQRLRTLKAER